MHDIGLWQDFPVYEHLLVHQLQMISGQTDHSFYIMLMFGERILENDNVAASQLAVRQHFFVPGLGSAKNKLVHQ